MQVWIKNKQVLLCEGMMDNSHAGVDQKSLIFIIIDIFNNSHAGVDQKIKEK